MSTISTTITKGITLGTITANGTYASPLTITQTGYIHNPGTGDAVFGPSSTAWTVYNYGRIAATSGVCAGIDLRGGGLVSNAGTISARTIGGFRAAGVYIAGAKGTVSNTGTVTAIGTYGIGVYLRTGSEYVTNGAGALIAGQPVAIEMIGTAGIVSSAGTIAGTTIGLGSALSIGGSFYGTISNAQSGLITGATAVRSSPMLVSNAGTMVGTNGDGLLLFPQTPTTVTNKGVIQGIGGYAIEVFGDATVINGDSQTTAALIQGAMESASLITAP